MNIYVGNLSHDVTQDELQQAFASHGEVASANIISSSQGSHVVSVSLRCRKTMRPVLRSRRSTAPSSKVGRLTLTRHGPGTISPGVAVAEEVVPGKHRFNVITR